MRFGYRDYDPATGRFTSLDPLGDSGGDHDLYDYCVDDPVSMNDPSGLFPPLLAFLAGKGLALGLGAGGAWVAGKFTDKAHSVKDGKEHTEATDAVKKVLPKAAAASAASAIPGAVAMGGPMAVAAARAASAASAAAAQRVTAAAQSMPGGSVITKAIPIAADFAQGFVPGVPGPAIWQRAGGLVSKAYEEIVEWNDKRERKKK